MTKEKTRIKKKASHLKHVDTYDMCLDVKEDEKEKERGKKNSPILHMIVDGAREKRASPCVLHANGARLRQSTDSIDGK